MSEQTEVIWTCKIGGPGMLEGGGQDFPMRQAVERAYREIVGRHPEFNFSGWGGELDECERAVVEDRLPEPHVCTRPPLRGRLAAVRNPEREKAIRLADVISQELAGGHRSHWCAEWQEDDHCLLCRRIAERLLALPDPVREAAREVVKFCEDAQGDEQEEDE